MKQILNVYDAERVDLACSGKNMDVSMKRITQQKLLENNNEERDKKTRRFVVCRKLLSKPKAKNKFYASKSVKWIFVLFSLLVPLTVTAVDISKSWFQPVLQVDEAPICRSMLRQTKAFFSGKSDSVVPLSLKPYRPHVWHGYPRSVQINDSKLYLFSYVHNDCGGACSTYQLLASSTPFPDRRMENEFYQSFIQKAAPAASRYQFLSSEDGGYYVFIPGEAIDQIHRLEEDASWTKICSVRKVPVLDDIKKIDVDFHTMQASLTNLKNLVQKLRGGVGESCGSMRTHERWSERMNSEFQKLLYMPRQKGIKDRFDIQKDSSYDHDIKNLELWSLKGLSEFEALNAYLDSLKDTIIELSDFYKKHFQWEEKAALAVADYALKYAISSGIRFYGYQPFKSQEEIELRRSILHRLPLDNIKLIDISSVKKPSKTKAWNDVNESLLSIAVTYPEALEYLLKQGLDPNAKNIFDKTPLMYAAQHNGYKAAKLLIDAGATINTGTIIPNDECNYNLKTSNMSALHYAVRYSGKDLIDLLVGNGASKYSNARDDSVYPSAIWHPIDWLKKYENENLTEVDLVELASTLSLAGSDEREALAKSLNVQGEKHYSEKNYSFAYEKFNEAIQVDTENIRALNNLALTSLKLGDKKRSLQASTKVIRSNNATPKQKASAFFNTGLACEASGTYGLRFDGKRYCKKNTLESFIDSYQSFPTKSRASAIVDRFDKRDMNEFACKAFDSNFEAVYKRGDFFFFLHKHTLDREIFGTERLFSKVDSFDIQRKEFTLALKNTVDLKNGLQVSKYKSNISIGESFAFEEGTCTPYSSRLIPEKNKLVYVQASSAEKSVDIEFDLNQAYTIILSGDVTWNVSERGEIKSDFIINDGLLSNPSEVSHTVLQGMHQKWSQSSSNNQYVASIIRSRIGKPIFTKFIVYSTSTVHITDQDIIQPKLIVVSPFSELDFYGYGDYKVAFLNPETLLKNAMTLEGVEVVKEDIGNYQVRKNFYFKVEGNGRVGRYFGDGYFMK